MAGKCRCRLGRGVGVNRELWLKLVGGGGDAMELWVKCGVKNAVGSIESNGWPGGERGREVMLMVLLMVCTNLFASKY